MAETEKITLNMSVVDLGKVDLLVREGFYQNRTDFLRAAIRAQLDKHEPEVRDTIIRNAFVIGVYVSSRKGLEAKLAKGERVNYNIIGMLIIENDVTPELAKQTIESVRVFGVFRARQAVKDALADRILI